MNLRKNIIFLVCCLLFVQFCYAQSESKPEHSPRKASIYSAALPGLGQFYNKKYWKIPIVYSGIGAFTYLAINNQQEFNRYRTAMLQRESGDIDEFTDASGVEIYNETALINNMDKYRRYRDLNIIGAFAIYVIQIVDANVDANLFDFDIGDDLSLRILPQTINNPYTRTPVTGIGCSIKF